MDIDAHNERFSNGEEAYQQGVNEYSDLSVDSFNNKLNGFIQTELTERVLPIPNGLAMARIPRSLNYTALGYVTPVKNQGLCGSCWSFRFEDICKIR
jgi:C1A family cysteine protease